MRAIEISRPGGPDVLREVERQAPRLQPNEVLIRVEAAGVNRPDIMQREGHYPPPPGASDLPGLEVAGTIVATRGDTRWREGDRVCALLAGGGYAEYCAAPAPQCLPIPSGMDAVTAAAIPETYFTVWTNLFQRGQLQPGERVLVHGGTSGIGSTAIQLACVFGATAYATAGTDEKCAACKQLGAVDAINYRSRDFVEAVRQLTRGGGVDVVLDIIGGDYLPRNIECLRMQGRLVQVGLIGGSKSHINLRLLLHNRLTITGSTLRPRTVQEKGLLARDLEAMVWPLLEGGQVRPLVHATFPLHDAAAAHRALESGEVVGKVVLTV
ncbi:MAG: NAD(P)H-quinone oxidoreductase [Acidobacteria bacterium]|nr:NAD(P)H-quinone oxidoreductase [Acidobacteriota bacterium]